MAKIVLPYILQEGTVAYAGKVMADFYAIMENLNNIRVEGLAAADLQTVLNALRILIDNCVVQDETGNAGQIVFADGKTMQEKVDSGDFKGADGVAAYADGWVVFEVDDNGHLLVTSNNDIASAFSFDEQGHLIYTVDKTGGNDPVTYDLGNVKGAKGDPGDVTLSAMREYVQSQLNMLAKSTVVDVSILPPPADDSTVQDGQWDATAKTAKVAITGITATNNFGFQPRTGTATKEQRTAWRNAQVYCISQSAGYVTFGADGVVPSIEIPLEVVINI